MKTMAIMKDVRFGMEDGRGPFLKFTTYIEESIAAAQFLPGTQAYELIRAYGVKDVHELEGKPVWVECGGPDGRAWGGTIEYVAPCVIT